MWDLGLHLGTEKGHQWKTDKNRKKPVVQLVILYQC
jgi:hypothetical protein